MRVTYLGTATLLLEIGSLRLITDPVLNPEAGHRYHAGFGLFYRSRAAPELPSAGLGKLDAVLLSHDEHGDNLDEAGRALLPQAGAVLTTRSGARRLGGNARGLAPFESTTVRGADGFELRITATPARHGPPLSLPVVGPVVGFVLEWEGQERGPLYVSGDTVYYRGIEEIAARFSVGTAILHVGAASFPIIGHVTLTADEAVRTADTLRAAQVVPVHFEGWSHFRDAREKIDDAFRKRGTADKLVWLPRGEPFELRV